MDGLGAIQGIQEQIQHHYQLTNIAVVVLAALGCGLLMLRLRQPALVGYILAGAILGPSGFALVDNRETIALFAELGVLMLLFLIGMELSLRGFREVWKIALTTTLLQIVVGLTAMTALSAATGWSAQLTILLGFVVALSSTAVAIKMLDDIGELRTRVGQITVGVLIAQDLAVVPMMLIVGSFGSSGAPAVEAVLKVGLSVGFLALLIFYLSRRKRIRLPFARLVGTNADLTPLAGLAFCFGASTISGLLGLSAAYGAFLAGLVIGNSTARKGMLRHSQPIQAILLMVFFLSIGLLIDLRFVWDNLATFLVVIFFVAVLKTALNIGLLRALGEPWPRAYLSGVLLAQMGEFSFILAALGHSVGAISWENHRFLVSVTALSLVTAPLWMTLARRLNRIALLRVTSGKEILRLTLGTELRLIIKSALRAENRLAALWIATVKRVRRRGKAPEAGLRQEATAEGGEALPVLAKPALAKPDRKPE